MIKENSKRIYIVFLIFCLYSLVLIPHNFTVFELFIGSDTDIKKVYLLSGVLLLFAFLVIYKGRIINLIKKELFWTFLTVVLFSEMFSNSFESGLFYKVFLMSIGDVIIINTAYASCVLSQERGSLSLQDDNRLLLESSSLEKVRLEKVKYKN